MGTIFANKVIKSKNIVALRLHTLEKCGVSTLNSDKLIMKNLSTFFASTRSIVRLSLICTGLLLALSSLSSCTSDDADPTDSDAYKVKDLFGTWQHHSLVTGLNEEGMWIRGIQTTNSSTATMNLTLATGTYDTTFTSSNFVLSQTGLLTSRNDANTTSYLSQNKRILVGTTKRGNSCTLVLQQKVTPGTLYSASDLQGVWKIHYVEGGGSFECWLNATMTVDINGNATLTNVDTNHGEQADQADVFSVSAEGVITSAENASYHGFMSSDKNLVAFNMTSEAGGAGFGVAQKVVTGTTYSATDLTGRWQIRTILVGSERFTEHGIMTIDANGTGVISDMIRDDGVIFDNPGNLDLSITAGGVISMAEDFNCFLSNDKQFVAGTRSDDSNQAFSLVLLQKMP